jgi:hypothetical protein
MTVQFFPMFIFLSTIGDRFISKSGPGGYRFFSFRHFFPSAGVEKKDLSEVLWRL